jgi:hypothetical protein
MPDLHCRPPLLERRPPPCDTTAPDLLCHPLTDVSVSELHPSASGILNVGYRENWLADLCENLLD